MARAPAARVAPARGPRRRRRLVLSSSRRHRRCSRRRRRRRRSPDRLLFPWLRPAWQLAGCQAWGGGRRRGESRTEDGREDRGGVGKGGSLSTRVTPGPACRHPDPGCRSKGKREFTEAGSRPAAKRPDAAGATHSEELG
jgi:hypothetical protein